MVHVFTFEWNKSIVQDYKSKVKQHNKGNGMNGKKDGRFGDNLFSINNDQFTWFSRQRIAWFILRFLPSHQSISVNNQTCIVRKVFCHLYLYKLLYAQIRV